MSPIRCICVSLSTLGALVLLAPPAAAQTYEEKNKGGTYHWQDENEYTPGPLPSSPPTPPADTEPPRPRAPEPPAAPFGAQGEVVLGGSSSLGVSSTQYTSQASYLSLSFSPGVDYFVLRNVSIGLGLGASYTDSKGYGADSSLVETQSTSLSAGPRFGWNLPLGGSFSFWPQATLGLEANRTTRTLVNGSSISVSSSAGAATTSQDGPWVSAYAPLLFHPVPHFYLGAGPTFFHEFARLQGGPDVGDQRTTVGVALTVGGYWGGTPPEGVATPPAPEGARAARFGDRGQLILSSDLAAYVSSTHYAGTTSSALQGGVVLGADYFFVDHVSFGLGASVSHYDSTGLDANQNTVTNDSTMFGVSVRLGVEIPITAAVSLYPRASLGFSAGTTDERSAAGEDAYSVSEAWVSLYVPLVVRVAPHFFAGFGPSVSQDISETDSFGASQVQNPATTLGAGLVLGGWL